MERDILLIYLPTSLQTYLTTAITIYQPIQLPTSLQTYLTTAITTYQPIHLPTSL
jgi:hypothetical protein